MAKMFNFSIIEGHIHSKIEHRPADHTRSAECTFTIRTEEDKLFLIRTQRQLADTCGKYLKKGSRVLVSGKLGMNKGAICIDCKEVNFLSPATA